MSIAILSGIFLQLLAWLSVLSRSLSVLAGTTQQHQHAAPMFRDTSSGFQCPVHFRGTDEHALSAFTFEQSLRAYFLFYLSIPWLIVSLLV